MLYIDQYFVMVVLGKGKVRKYPWNLLHLKLSKGKMMLVSCGFSGGEFLIVM